MSVSRTAKRAYKFSRRLVADGVMGSELVNKIESAFPTLKVSEKRKIARKLSRDYGVLGHFVHDPNLYSNCGEAREVKKASRNAHKLVATVRTPYCASCAYNRRGTCGLMGGKLVESSDGLTDDMVKVAARQMIQDQQITRKVASKIVKSDETPREKINALREVASKREVDVRSETRAMNSSRNAAAILSTSHTNKFDVKPHRREAKKNNGRTAGMEVGVPGDESVEQKTRKANKMFHGSGMTLLPTQKWEGSAQVKIASKGITSVPDFEAGKGTSRIATVEEHSRQASELLSGLAKKASKRLARGRMTSRLASTILGERENLLGIGARSSREDRRIFAQLENMVGHLSTL